MAKKKVTLVYDLADPNSLLIAVAMMSKYRKETLSTISLVDQTVYKSTGDLDTEIAALAADQELILTAVTSGSNWGATQQAALVAKLDEDGTIYNWGEDNESLSASASESESEAADGLRPARRMWNDLAGTQCTPSEMVYLIGTEPTELSAALQVKRLQYAAGLVAKALKENDGGDGVEMDTSTATLKFIADAIDVGLWSDLVNDCFDANLSQPQTSLLVVADIFSNGEAIYNYTTITSYLPDESESASASVSGEE